MNILDQFVGGLRGSDKHVAIRQGEPVDRLKPVPSPGLYPFTEGVVNADGDVHLFGLIAGHVLLKLFYGIGNDRKVFGGNAVSLRAVAVTAKRDPPPPGPSGGKHNASGDSGRQILLKDPPVHDLTGEVSHLSLLVS